MKPSVSILIPTHNRAEILRRTLESLFAVERSSEAVVELVVVANACADHTGTMCRDVLQHSPFAARYIEEPVMGVSHARNRAVSESTGEICAFLDDDVLIARDWLLELLQAWGQLPADMIAGRVDLVWEEERPAWLTPRFEQFLSANHFGDQPIEMRVFRRICC